MNDEGKSDPFDLENLAVDPEEVAFARAAPKPALQHDEPDFIGRYDDWLFTVLPLRPLLRVPSARRQHL
jgi:hypothetical protein